MSFDDHNMDYLGMLPTGETVFVSKFLLAQRSEEELFDEMIAPHWLRLGMLPRGYRWHYRHLGDLLRQTPVAVRDRSER